MNFGITQGICVIQLPICSKKDRIIFGIMAVDLFLFGITNAMEFASFWRGKFLLFSDCIFSGGYQLSS
nr:hypothetical protein Itr_chr01CG09840 [Ipomoea trifida]GMC46834.1 hypothetical protein Iba_chr01aCG5770 [Ipomoea batatas]GMC52926.1 hypothetical protein Iba_chr01dCG1910 [Ipomoea batatas]